MRELTLLAERLDEMVASKGDPREMVDVLTRLFQEATTRVGATVKQLMEDQGFEAPPIPQLRIVSPESPQQAPDLSDGIPPLADGWSLLDGTKLEPAMRADLARTMVIKGLTMAYEDGIDEETIGSWIDEAIDSMGDSEERCGVCLACLRHAASKQQKRETDTGLN